MSDSELEDGGIPEEFRYFTSDIKYQTPKKHK